MASITINHLHPSGVELFMDSETFLNELKSDDLDTVNGGISPIVAIAVASSAGCAAAAGAVVGAGAVIGGYAVGKLLK